MKAKLRRAAWVGVGVVAVPAAFLGTLELVAPIWIIIVGMVALVLARWRALDHLITLVAVAFLPWAIVDTARRAADRSHDGGDWFVRWTILWISIAAMTIASAKLGRIAGHAAWER